jgi:hypothetical protein
MTNRSIHISTGVEKTGDDWLTAIRGSSVERERLLGDAVDWLGERNERTPDGVCKGLSHLSGYIQSLAAALWRCKSGSTRTCISDCIVTDGLRMQHIQ